MQRTIAVALACLWLSGCVAYRGGAVPRIELASLSAGRLERVFVIDVTAESNVGDDLDIQKIAASEIETALRTAGAELKQSGAVADPDGTLQVTVTANGSVVGQMLSGFISGLTFMVIPAYAGIKVDLDATAKLRDGTTHRYHYGDDYSLWIEIFLLPFSTNPDRVLKELVADMSRSLARDMQRDGVLPKPVGSTAVTPLNAPAPR